LPIDHATNQSAAAPVAERLQAKIHWNRRLPIQVARSMTQTDYTQIGPAIGEAFPEFELPNADGVLVRLHDWRRGRRALVVFYRSAAW
jgi:hypothetical protein